MPTKLLRMPYAQRVLPSHALRRDEINGRVCGFTLDIGLNYYRGLPLSAIEEFSLTIDGEAVPETTILLELGGKLFTLDQARAAIGEFWSIKKSLRLRSDSRVLDPGTHRIQLMLTLRNVYMYFDSGEWGLVDGSHEADLELQELVA